MAIGILSSMSKGRIGRRTRQMVQIAKERIDILFNLAEKEAIKKCFKRANRYVTLAKKIGMRYNVRIPKHYNRNVCKYCSSFLVPSVNCRVRLKNKKLIVLCLGCMHYTRMPFIRERKERMKYGLKKEKIKSRSK